MPIQLVTQCNFTSEIKATSASLLSLVSLLSSLLLLLFNHNYYFSVSDLAEMAETK